MSDYTIYALKVRDGMREPIMEALRSGEGRFGWSYTKTADLRALKKKVDAGKELTDDEQDCAQWFLLELKEGDYVVYINTPEYGQCTLARVTGPYVWRWEDRDFNHRIPVDPKTVRTFDRNEVKPKLSARLKLQGRYWRIYAREEFQHLLTDGPSKKSGGEHLADEFKPLLSQITQAIQRTHPGKALELLCVELFRRIPGVQDVRAVDLGGHGKGADLVVRLDSGLPIAQLTEQKTLLVQVKSYEGEHWVTGAVDDIRRAFEHYPEAHMGLIISTAQSKTEPLEQALEALRQELGKPVALLLGDDVARLFLQHGAHILLGSGAR